MSRQFDIERLYRTFAEIPQTVSATSRERPGIQQTMSVGTLALSLTSAAPSLTKLAEQFPLGWSHYITLLSVTNPDARRFYEIEAAGNGWSVRELKRQLDGSLYEHVALSCDRHEVRRLAREEQLRCYVLINLKSGETDPSGSRPDADVRELLRPLREDR